MQSKVRPLLEGKEPDGIADTAARLRPFPVSVYSAYSAACCADRCSSRSMSDMIFLARRSARSGFRNTSA